MMFPVVPAGSLSGPDMIDEIGAKLHGSAWPVSVKEFVGSDERLAKWDPLYPDRIPADLQNFLALLLKALQSGRLAAEVELAGRRSAVSSVAFKNGKATSFLTAINDRVYFVNEKEFRDWLNSLTTAGNPAGEFPPDKHAALDAVFTAAGDCDADALVYALGELRLHFQLNLLAKPELVLSKLALQFHAIGAAANDLIKKLKAVETAARFGLPEQIREGLKTSADREAGGTENVEFDADTELQDSIRGIFQIRRWATDAKKSTRGPNWLARAEFEKGPTFDICDEIFEIWSEVLKKPLKASNTSGQVHGPLIDFAVCCLELLDHDPIKPGGIRGRLRRYRERMAKWDFPEI
jgi:hypothetical protein